MLGITWMQFGLFLIADTLFLGYLLRPKRYVYRLQGAVTPRNGRHHRYMLMEKEGKHFRVQKRPSHGALHYD